MPNVFISGTGAYVPEKIVPNSFLKKSDLQMSGFIQN